MTTKLFISEIKFFTKNVLFLALFVALTSCSNDDGTVMPPTTGTEQQQVFQEFWDIYDRYYPLMHRKNIDWQQVHDTYHPRINAATTDNQLFTMFQEIMQNTIKDGHSSLTFNNNKEATYDPEFDENVQTMLQNNTDGKINYVASSTNNAYISYGTLAENGDIGYIKSKVFEPMSESDAEFTSYRNIVDEALTFLQNKDGIIVDVRTNGGGQASFAFYLAGRFFTNGTSPIRIARQRVKTTTGSTEASLGEWLSSEYGGVSESRAEDGGTFGSVFPAEFDVQATGNFQFTNKVALLTSQNSASSAEYFTAAMKTQDHVRSIGEKTFGIFAGSENMTLTNGSGKWVTRVSAQDVEVFYNGNFQSFEGTGIPPDQELVPTVNQVSNGEDVHIAAAVEYITN